MSKQPTAPKQRLTQLGVDRLKLEPGERAQLPDGTIPGLELRASWGGTKRYWLRFRFRGQQFRHRLGEHPAVSLGEARKAARAILAKLDQGINPLARVETSGTVRSVYEDWLLRDQAGNRTLRETKRIFEREVLPAWGDRSVESIRRRDVIALVDSIADRGSKVMANRSLSRVRRMFAWAAGRDLTEGNPAQYVEKSPEKARERVLEVAELAAVWHAAGDMGVYGVGVRVLILTAARRAEVFEARWREIDLDGDEPAIRLPPERSKVAEGRAIPLSALAVEILRAVRPSEPKPDAYALSLTGEHPLGSVGKLKIKLDAQLPGITPWTIHDLRRSVATSMQRRDVHLQTIEAVLGHVSGSRAGIVGRYQRHTFAQEARDALEEWGSHFGTVILSPWEVSACSAHASRGI